MSNNAAGKPEKTIKGRYVIGDPAGTFDERPRMARQPGRISHRSDWAADISRIGGLLVMGASLRGAMHYGLSTVRQDSFAIGAAESEGDSGPKWIVAAISDGVSSASQSHTFADYMARQAIIAAGEELSGCNPESLRSIEWGSVARRLVDTSVGFCRSAAMRTVPEDKAADVSKASPRDFAAKWAATLEFSVVQADCGTSGTREYVHVTVAGDGAAYVLSKERGWQTIKAAKSQPGAVASNAVLPLPLEPRSFAVSFGHLGNKDCLVLATDGLGDFIGDGNTPLGDFLKRKLPGCKSLATFLPIVDVSMYQADDDRTLILVKEAD